MRRKTTVTIADEGRDKGKTFELTEMFADQGERWANRFIFLLANAGKDVDIPDELIGSGMRGLAQIGAARALQALSQVRFEYAEPLLIEMMECVQYRHAQNQPVQPIFARELCQIEEVKTFWTLRLAWLELALGFTLAELFRKSPSASTEQAALSSTSTSLESSAAL